MRRGASLSAALALGLAPCWPQGVPFWTTFQEVAGPRAIERAAQVRQESAFNPKAVSPVGARGLCQFMPKTWEAYAPPGADPFDPVAGIQAQHKFMLWLERYFKGDHAKALGGYNAGPGSIRKAERLASQWGLSGSRAWLTALPQVTGRHAQETITYVHRIETIHMPWVQARVGSR